MTCRIAERVCGDHLLEADLWGVISPEHFDDMPTTRPSGLASPIGPFHARCVHQRAFLVPDAGCCAAPRSRLTANARSESFREALGIESAGQCFENESVEGLGGEGHSNSDKIGRASCRER